MVSQPIDLLAVASWYPSRLDPIAGRFVADQLEALAATGLVRPSAASFEPAEVIGSGAVRSRIAALVSDLAAEPVRARPGLFRIPAPGASGAVAAPPIPIARLTIPSGRNPAAGALHGAVARDAALAALAERYEHGREHDLPRPTLVHAHTVYPDGAAAATLAHRLGVPLVLTEHASFVARLIAEPAVRARYEATVAAAERLVVVSRVLAGELVAALPAVEPRLTVIPNGIPVESFPLVARGDRVADELVFVGYRKASKGIETLLRAFAVVVADRPSTTLRLVGSSPSDEIERGWHRLAAELGIGAAVRFDPAADRNGVGAALARASLFVHPSPRETFGVVAVEALATGLPVVAADSGGVTEILGDEPDALGCVVPGNDHLALAAGIRMSLGRIGTFDPERLRAAVVGRFDAATVARRLTDLYLEVLEQSRPRPAAAPSSHAAAAVPASTPSEAAATGRRRVLVAIDPDRAALVARLAGDARSGLVLVTSAGFSKAAGDGLAGIVETDLGGRVRALADAAALGPPVTGVRRILRAVRHPLAVARRRGWLPGLERLVEQRGARAIRSAIARAGEHGASPTDIICVDGVDHLAARSVLAAGEARLAHGGFRRLGDEA
ncbi:MAG: glycosyltransferase [Chloroflexota bacterium]|nr:MAG: glycosyltransferase [Chloroflexota bacterium]